MNPKRNFAVLTFCRQQKKQKCLKRVAVGATGLLNNEPEAQFRGFDICRQQKKYKFTKTHFYYQNDVKLGPICSHAHDTAF